MTSVLKEWHLVARYKAHKRKAFGYLKSRHTKQLLDKCFSAIKNVKQSEEASIRNYYLKSKFTVWRELIARTADLRRKFIHTQNQSQLRLVAQGLSKWRESYFYKVTDLKIATPFSQAMLLNKAMKGLVKHCRVEKLVRDFGRERLLRLGLEMMVGGRTS